MAMRGCCAGSSQEEPRHRRRGTETQPAVAPVPLMCRKIPAPRWRRRRGAVEVDDDRVAVLDGERDEVLGAVDSRRGDGEAALRGPAHRVVVRRVVVLDPPVVAGHQVVGPLVPGRWMPKASVIVYVPVGVVSMPCTRCVPTTRPLAPMRAGLVCHGCHTPPIFCQATTFAYDPLALTVMTWSRADRDRDGEAERHGCGPRPDGGPGGEATSVRRAARPGRRGRLAVVGIASGLSDGLRRVRGRRN